MPSVGEHELATSVGTFTPMSAAINKIRTLSIEEYLEAESKGPIKHEYVDGYVYAMVGTSKPHNTIVVNLASALRGHLRGGPCRVFVVDIKVQIASRFYYPDVIVSCERDKDPYVETKPRLVIEVLSDSTERIDRQEKKPAYQQLVSLQEYVLVAQDRMEVQIYRRTGIDWELKTYHENEQVELASVGLTLPIEQIYEDVEL